MPVKDELSIRRELRDVRAMLAEWRRRGHEDMLLYGVQQALGWVLGELSPPSELVVMIQELAEKEANDAASAE